jgi:hypothetical protein
MNFPLSAADGQEKAPGAQSNPPRGFWLAHHDSACGVRRLRKQGVSRMNTVAKRTLTPEVVSTQSAFELPDRQLLALVTVVITNLLNNLSIDVDVRNNNVAVQVCAVVNAITANNLAVLSCEVKQ